MGAKKNETEEVSENLKVAGAKSTNYLENLQLYVFAFIVLGLVSLIIYSLSKVKCLMKKLLKLKQ